MRKSTIYTLVTLLFLVIQTTNAQLWEYSDPIKLGENINSEAEESIPILSKNQSTLYFVRTFEDEKKEGKTDQDIWFSTKDAKGNFTVSQPLKDLNNKFNNAVQAVNSDGTSLYVLNSYQGKKHPTKGVAISMMAISMMEKSKWREPNKIEIPNLLILEEFCGFYINEDENVVIISYLGPDTQGEEDLYVSVKENKKWGAPIHMGTKVNSTGFEISPFLTKSQDTLFFSSNGFGGEGQADIFYSVRQNKNWTSWSAPVNLGPKVNSEKFDAYFVHSGKQAYWSSNKEGERSDIYMANIIPVLDTIRSLVVDQSNNSLKVKVHVYIKNDDNQWEKTETVQLGDDGKFAYPVSRKERYKFVFEGEGKVSETLYFPDEKAEELRDYSKEHFKEVRLDDASVTSKVKDQITEHTLEGVSISVYDVTEGNKELKNITTTDESGEWEHSFDRNRDYEVEMNAEGYEKEVFEIPSIDKGRNRKFYLDGLSNIALTPESKAGDIIKINNIYFGFNSATITQESLLILDNLITFLNAKPEIRIELGAYTDCVGPNSYNLKLSKKRAKSCFDYLVSKGISSDRLKSKGYGETKILNGCTCTKVNQCSEEENAINRRIEIKIL